MRRDLLRTEAGVVVIGAVVLGEDGPVWEGSADRVFRGWRDRMGDLAACEMLLDEGWSNGQGSVWLGDLNDA